MQNQYFRTFIGIPVQVGPGFLSARQEMIRILKGERISWVVPERYHVTLRFLGDTGLKTATSIGKAILEQVEVPARSMISLERPGLFGPPRNPQGGVGWIWQ